MGTAHANVVLFEHTNGSGHVLCRQYICESTCIEVQHLSEQCPRFGDELFQDGWQIFASSTIDTFWRSTVATAATTAIAATAIAVTAAGTVTVPSTAAVAAATVVIIMTLDM